MKKTVKKKPGRPPGRKAPGRPVLSTRVPLPFYETLKLVAQASGRTMSEELIWRTTQALEARDIVENARKEALELLAEARNVNENVKQDAFLKEMERRYTRVRGIEGDYWMTKGAKPLQFSLTPEFQTVIDEAVKKAFAAAKGESK